MIKNIFEYFVTNQNQCNEKVTLKYSEIFDINIQEDNEQCFFNIYYADNKLTIAQRMLSDKKTFDELVNFISNKVTNIPIKHYRGGSGYDLHLTI